MSRFQQYGLHCSSCGEDIYSNARHDFVECRCGAWFIDGGWDYMRCGGSGLSMSEPMTVTREVDRRTLPARYRDEVPA